MTPGDFEHRNGARWDEYERLVGNMERDKPAPEAGQLPRLFRELSLDLSLAESRMYGARVTERLNELVIRGYELIYRTRRGGLENAVTFVAVTFPRAVRAEWRLFWLCNAVFWLPFFALWFSAHIDIRWVQAVLGPDGMAGMEQMYGGKREQLSHLRSEYGSNFMMFCFYIYNNVAIDFRIFAGGMAAGLGTLFFLLFNGLQLGAAAGYVDHACNPESFWSFVAGHSSFELLGMIVSGMAGMRLGLAILRPGRLPRVRALVEASREALPLIYGAALMTALAAVVEGFWSARAIPSGLKYAVGIAGWALHIAYFSIAEGAPEMRLDTVTAEIRPRSDWEAADLGFAMVRRSFWRCIAVWWLATAVPTALATVWLWKHPFLLLALFWWWKPAGSRMVLFELSRRLFGEEPAWRSVWREVPRAWWRRFFHRFVWARFSPWLPVTLAVEDLEGLRRKAYKQRCKQVVRRGEGVVMWIYFLSDIAAVWLGLGLLAVVTLLLPDGQGSAWQNATEAWDPEFGGGLPLFVARIVAACVMAAMSLTDVFVIGAGFGVYINNRTWIEGWDVELAFKRLARRVGKAAVVALAFFMVALPARSDARPPAEIIREVKADPAFTVHTVTNRVPVTKPRKSPGWNLKWLGALSELFAICMVGLLVFLLGWVVWKYRHVFLTGRRGPRSTAAPPPAARVVMGMAISPETLPGDVPAAAWALWQQGRRHEALALLYRGSISRVVELGRVEIQESDTEGDCLRHVERAGAGAHPGYFRAITGMWSRLAYAGIDPADAEVEARCREWPFGERRKP